MTVVPPGQQNTSGCEPCTPGQYCGSTGMSSPSGDCDAGWYCTGGSSLATPTSPEGGKCLAGEARGWSYNSLLLNMVLFGLFWVEYVIGGLGQTDRVFLVRDTISCFLLLVVTS